MIIILCLKKSINLVNSSQKIIYSSSFYGIDGFIYYYFYFGSKDYPQKGNVHRIDLSNYNDIYYGSIDFDNQGYYVTYFALQKIETKIYAYFGCCSGDNSTTFYSLTKNFEQSNFTDSSLDCPVFSPASKGWTRYQNNKIGDNLLFYVDGYYICNNGKYDTDLSRYPNFRYEFNSSITSIISAIHNKIFYVYYLNTFYKYQINENQINYIKKIACNDVSNMINTLGLNDMILFEYTGNPYSLVQTQEKILLPNIESGSSLYSYYIKIKN